MRYQSCLAAAPSGEGELVEFLAGFSRDFAPTIILGQEFLQAVIETVLHPTLITPFSRVSLLAANMASPPNKVIDGIARLITKTDVERLKSTKLRSDVEKLEGFLNKHWTNIKQGNHPKHVWYKVFGKAAIRALLLILNKEKVGPEGKEYKTLDAIETQMNEELKGASQQVVAVASGDQKQEDTSMIGLADAAKPMFNVISVLKLKLGQAIVYKEQPDKVWTCIRLDDTGMQLEYTSMLDSTTMKLHLKPEEIKGNIRVVKENRIPKLLDIQIAESLFANMTCSMEMQKAELFMVLMNAYNSNDTDTSHVMFQEQPDKFMYAYTNIKAKELIFVPVTDKVSSIVETEPKGTHATVKDDHGHVFYILPPKQIKKAEDGTYSGTLAPFWLLASMKPSEEGKMQMSTIKVKQFTIQVFHNVNSLLAHDIIAIKEDDKEKGKSKKRKAQ